MPNVPVILNVTATVGGVPLSTGAADGGAADELVGDFEIHVDDANSSPVTIKAPGGGIPTAGTALAAGERFVLRNVDLNLITVEGDGLVRVRGDVGHYP